MSTTFGFFTLENGLEKMSMRKFLEKNAELQKQIMKSFSFLIKKKIKL